MVVELGDFKDSFEGIGSWDEAAGAASNLIFMRADDGMLSLDIQSLRDYLDECIGLVFGDNASKYVTQPMCFIFWEELGAIGLRLSRSLGFDLDRDFLISTLIRKQRDYGHENIARFGRIGLFVRLHDKVARLENLLQSGATPENESLTDNLLDVLGYCAIGLMWEAEMFLRPLERR